MCPSKLIFPALSPASARTAVVVIFVDLSWMRSIISSTVNLWQLNWSLTPLPVKIFKENKSPYQNSKPNLPNSRAITGGELWVRASNSTTQSGLESLAFGARHRLKNSLYFVSIMRDTRRTKPREAANMKEWIQHLIAAERGSVAANWILICRSGQRTFFVTVVLEQLKENKGTFDKCRSGILTKRKRTN